MKSRMKTKKKRKETKWFKEPNLELKEEDKENIFR